MLLNESFISLSSEVSAAAAVVYSVVSAAYGCGFCC